MPRYRDTEISRYRSSEISKRRDTEKRRYRDTEIRRHRDTEIATQRETERPIFRGADDERSPDTETHIDRRKRRNDRSDQLSLTVAQGFLTVSAS